MYLQYNSKLDNPDWIGLQDDVQEPQHRSAVDHYDEFTLDCNGFVIAAQLPPDSITNYTRDEILGKNISIFYSPIDVQEKVYLNDLNEALLKTEQTTFGQRVDRNRRFFWARMDFISFKNGIGELMGYRVKISDLGNYGRNSQSLIANATYSPFAFTKLPIPTRTGYVFIEFRDIIRCQSDVNYSIFYLVDGGKIVSSKSLSHFELLLSPVNFLRIHKSDIINLSHIKCYTKGDGGSVTMIDNTEITVSRTFKPCLVAKLNLLSTEK